MDWLWDSAAYLAVLTGGGIVTAACLKWLGVRPALIAGAATALLLGAVFVLDLMDDKARLQTELTETKATLERERKQNAAVDVGTVAAEKIIVTVEKTVEKLVEVERKAADAPPSEDGPVAPVLRDALDGLRDAD